MARSSAQPLAQVNPGDRVNDMVVDAGVRRDGDPTLVGDSRVILGCREKPRRDGAGPPVPETDTGGRAEHA